MSVSNKKNFSYYFVQNIFAGVVPIISLAIFTRIFSPEEYGLYALMLIFGNFFSSITSFGLGFSYEKLFFELDENKKDILLNSIILFCFSLFILFFIPIYIFGNKILDYFEIVSVSNGLLYSSYIASNLIAFSNFFLLKYRNEKNAKMHSILSLILIIGQLLCSILFIIYLEYSIEGFFYSSILINFIILIIHLKDISFIKIFYQLNNLKKAIIIAYPLIPKMVTGYLNSSYDKIILGLLKDQGSLGVYDISYKISSQCYSFCNVLNNTFVPDFYIRLNNWTENSKKEVPEFLLKYFITYLFYCICLSFFSYEIISLVLSQEFHFAINVTSILCIFFSFYFFQTVPVLVHLGKSLTVSKLTVLFFIISIIIAFPATYFFGIYGLAVGLAISNLISAIIYLNTCQKNLELEWDFKLIITSYLFLILSTCLIIILREIELVYFIRLITKLSLLTVFVFYVHHNQIIDFKYYFNHILKKIKIYIF